MICRTCSCICTMEHYIFDQCHCSLHMWVFALQVIESKTSKPTAVEFGHVAATPDLMLGYLDSFSAEMRRDQIFLFASIKDFQCVLFLEVVPPTIWYRLVAGLNAHLRLVRGRLKTTLMPVLSWIETHASPLKQHGVCIDLARIQASTLGYSQLGLVVYAVERETSAIDGGFRVLKMDELSQSSLSDH